MSPHPQSPLRPSQARPRLQDSRTNYVSAVNNLNYLILHPRWFPQSPLLTHDSQDTPSGTNVRPGFFAGASHVNAIHGIFTDVAGDLNITEMNINVEAQRDDFLALDKLPRAKEAGYFSEPHQPCLAGTRKAELQRIEQWAVDYANKRVYWLNGNAGSGKSTIAQTFAERSFAEGRLGASFFCSRDFPDRRNIRLIFPTLAYGLAYLHTQFRERLLQTLSFNPNVGHESLANQLESLQEDLTYEYGMFIPTLSFRP